MSLTRSRVPVWPLDPLLGLPFFYPCNPVYVRSLDPSVLEFSVSLYWHPFICILFGTHFTSYNKQTRSSLGILFLRLQDGVFDNCHNVLLCVKENYPLRWNNVGVVWMMIWDTSKTVWWETSLGRTEVLTTIRSRSESSLRTHFNSVRTCHTEFGFDVTIISVHNYPSPWKLWENTSI